MLSSCSSTKQPQAGLSPRKPTGTVWGGWGTRDHFEDLAALGPLAGCSPVGTFSTGSMTQCSVPVTTVPSVAHTESGGGKSCCDSKLTGHAWWDSNAYSQSNLGQTWTVGTPGVLRYQCIPVPWLLFGEQLLRSLDGSVGRAPKGSQPHVMDSSEVGRPDEKVEIRDGKTPPFSDRTEARILAPLLLGHCPLLDSLVWSGA